MNKVIDPGHMYKLLVLDDFHDDTYSQILTFVKRCDYKNPEKFPGNKNRYAGTTCQSVIRCLLDRMRYLQNQIPCRENEGIIQKLQECLYLFEHRAAIRHGINFDLTLKECEELPMCPECGHVKCKHET